MTRLLAAGALAASALTACGGSDPKDGEESGRGTLQGNEDGAGGGTTATDADDDTLDCGVGSTRRLSPSSDEDVGLVLSVDGNIIFGTDSGLYRLPAAGTSAPEKLLDGDPGNFFANGSQIGVLQFADDDSVQLRWVPAAGGAGTSVTLPAVGEVRWSYDKARNSMFAVTSRRPFTYLRHDLSSGQTETFTTDLSLDTNDPLAATPSALLALRSGDNDVDELYRIDKGTTTAVRLAPDFAQASRLEAVSDDDVYLQVLAGTGVPSGNYRVPVDGSSPPVRIEGFRGTRVDSTHIYSTDQGVFGQDYDGRSYKVFPVGAAAVGDTLFEYGCGVADNLTADAPCRAERPDGRPVAPLRVAPPGGLRRCSPAAPRGKRSRRRPSTLPRGMVDSCSVAKLHQGRGLLSAGAQRRGAAPAEDVCRFGASSCATSFFVATCTKAACTRCWIIFQSGLVSSTTPIHPLGPT